MLSPVREDSPNRLFGLSAGDPGSAPGNVRRQAPVNRTMWVRHELQIETTRLILRAYGVGDYDRLHEMVSNPDMFHFSHRGPMTSEESWSLLLRHVGHWRLFGYGVFAAFEKATGRFVGETGACDFRRRLGPDFDTFPEITWSMQPSIQGRGYATEAAAAALDWLERDFTKPRTVCLIHEGNAASIAVAERLGFRPFERRPYRNYTALLMVRDSSAT